MKPAWDGIAGWVLVLAALLMAVIAWDHVINGADFVAALAFAAGVALLAWRLSHE